MTLLNSAPVVFGSQTPRLSHWPEYVSSSGQEVVELAALAELHLDPWQQFVLEHALGESADGTWAAQTVGLVVPRQNGKGAIIEARELAGLFLFGEELIIHSAHQFKTAMDGFRRIEALVRGVPDFHRQVARYSHSNGSEGIYLRDGRRLLFQARSKSSGRGFTADTLILDEAMEMSKEAQASLLPTLSSVENPQVWYLGSPVDQRVHLDGYVFAGVREAGLARDSETAFFEWSLDQDLADEALSNLDDPSFLVPGNPGLGYRQTVKKIWALERPPKMTPEGYLVERLGVGDWPVTGESTALVTDDEIDECHSEWADVDGNRWVAFDVTPGMSSASIGEAGWTVDGDPVMLEIETKAGSGWLVDRIKEIAAEPDVVGVIADDKGPAGAVIKALAKEGVAVHVTTTTELSSACGLVLNGFREGTLRHRGDKGLLAAIRGAGQRSMGDGAWAWSRKSSDVNIAPLMAATQAFGAAYEAKPKAVEPWFRAA